MAEQLFSGGMLREWSVGTTRPFRGCCNNPGAVDMDQCGNKKWLDSGYISERANGICSQTGCGVREKERNRG